MVSPSQLASWQPARLSEIAEAVVGHRRSLTGLHDDLDAGRPPASWTFEDATAARTEHDRLSSALATQVAETTGVIEALDAAATSLAAAKELLQGAMRRGGYNGLHIDHATGAVSIARTFDDEDELAYARTVQQEVAEQIETALADAAAADQALAAALTAAATTDVNDIGSLADQQALLDFQSMSPADQVRYLLDHPEAYALLGEHLSPEVKAGLGAEVADGLDRMARDPQAFGDADTVARYTALLGALGDDPDVMAPMYRRLGADGLLGTYDGLASFMGYSDDPNLATLAGELRSGLQVATRAEGFDGEAFGQELVQLATRTADGDTMDAYFDTYPSSPLHAAVLDYLMRDGDYGEDFVRGVAWQLDEFERTVDPQLVQSWMQHTGMGSPLNGLDADPGSLLGRTPDPMGATMGQLGKHPALGLEFFSDGDGEERAEFYFAERDWSRDGFQGIAEAALGIGTDPGNIENAGEDTGMLVSRFFDLLPDNPRFDADHAAAGAEPVADLLKHYMPAVESALRDEGSADLGARLRDIDTKPYLGSFTNYPVLDFDDLDGLLKVALSTEDGMARIAEGVAGYRQVQLTNFAMQHPDGAGSAEMGTILADSARLEGLMQGAVGAIAIDGAVSRDQQVAAFTGLVSEAAGLLPVPYADEMGDVVGDLGKKAWETAWGHVQEIPSDRITETFGNYEDSTRAEQAREAQVGRSRMVITTYLSLAEAGVVEVPENMRDTWMPGGRLISLESIPPEQFQAFRSEAGDALGQVLDVATLELTYKDPMTAWEPR